MQRIHALIILGILSMLSVCSSVSWQAAEGAVTRDADTLREVRTPDVTVTNLRCEYRTAPLGIDALQPRVSWQLKSEVRGQKQTAFQVLVASHEALLKQAQGDMWASGKVDIQEQEQLESGQGELDLK